MSDSNKIMPVTLNRSIVFPILWFLIGGLIYFNLQGIIDYFIYGLLGLDEDQYFTAALHFFVLQLIQVFLLLVSIIFIVGIIRSFFSP